MGSIPRKPLTPEVLADTLVSSAAAVATLEAAIGVTADVGAAITAADIPGQVAAAVTAEDIPQQVSNAVTGADIPGEVSAAVTAADIPGQVAGAVTAADIPGEVSAAITAADIPGLVDDAVAALDATVTWDDLRFPVQGINPVGAAADPTRITDLATYPGCFSFSGSQDNVIAGVAQMPHSWKRGTALHPHIHWVKPTGSSSAVTWQFYYRVVGNPGDVAGAWSSAQAVSQTIGDPTVSNSGLLSSFPTIDMTGFKESAIVAWRIERVGSTDADNNAVVLLEFDIHFEADKRGTAAEIPV